MKLRHFFVLLLMCAVAACESTSAEGSPPIGFEEGNRGPILEGVDAFGQPMAFAASGQPGVIVFYSSAACGLCRVQLENLQAHLPAYDREGARVVAVTLDPPEVSNAFREEVGLEYAVLTVDSATFDEWVPRDSALGGPLPAAYIVDSSGVIVFRHVGRNASDRASDAAMVSILSSLKSP